MDGSVLPLNDYSYTLGQDLLVLENVSLTLDGNPILRDINLTVKNIVRPGHTQGQVDAVLAPSGMGKSQLFRCIAGLQKPTTGKITLGDGQPEHAHTIEPGMVGLVAQDYPLFNHLTVIDNLMVAATIKQKERKAALATCMSYLDSLGLTEAARKYPHQISGGMRQRVALIQQIVSCGYLLLMDEPTSGLDPLRRERVLDRILTISQSNDLSSVIMSTHDIDAAITVADTIILLGREKDAQGNYIPGATIRHTYNLIDEGLAWHPGIEELPRFREVKRDIMARFREL